MFPAVATGAQNPEPGQTAAVMMSVDASLQSIQGPPDPAAADPVAEGLARHMAAAFARCRELGHREARIALTRPAELALAIGRALERAGLVPAVTPARQFGCLTLTLAV